MSRPCLVFAALAALVVACNAPPPAGQWGTIRYIGQVKGQPPLSLVPPISDRGGNLYTLYGAIGLPEAAAFVSRATGGSIQACTLTKGDTYGAHGWAGFAQDRAWYWSGYALVLVVSNGQCARVLDTDPSTNVDLQFRAVLPWVRSAPSRTTLVAWIQSPVDSVPYSALIDLDTGIATNIVQFQPSDATNVAVIGVGASPDGAGGFVLLSYDRGGSSVIEGRFFDPDANLVATAPINGLPPPEYGVTGYLEADSAGRVVGLTTTGSIVTFDRSGGQLINVDPSVGAVGVHSWDGKLWLVGSSGAKPVIAAIDPGGQPQGAIEWTASELAASGLGGNLNVRDDRSVPPRSTTWTGVATAIGSSPFVGPFSPWPHAPGTTLWVAAGPELGTDTTKMTAIAIAPVGISYP